MLVFFCRVGSEEEECDDRGKEGEINELAIERGVFRTIPEGFGEELEEQGGRDEGNVEEGGVGRWVAEKGGECEGEDVQQEGEEQEALEGSEEGFRRVWVSGGEGWVLMNKVDVFIDDGGEQAVYGEEGREEEEGGDDGEFVLGMGESDQAGAGGEQSAAKDFTGDDEIDFGGFAEPQEVVEGNERGEQESVEDDGRGGVGEDEVDVDEDNGGSEDAVLGAAAEGGGEAGVLGLDGVGEAMGIEDAIGEVDGPDAKAEDEGFPDWGIG